jgi:hypothetical protein
MVTRVNPFSGRVDLGISDADIFGAKTKTLNDFIGLVTPANVKGLWLFDQNGASSGITDRATLGGATAHPATLRDGGLAAINANVCAPGLLGLAPCLGLDATHLWNTPDSADFTAALTALSVIWAGKPVDLTDCTFAAKLDLTTGTEQREWGFFTDGNDKIFFNIYDNIAPAIIGRYYNTAITADENGIHSYIGTYNGGTLASGIKIYKDGLVVDDTNNTSGSFTTMRNTTSLVGSYYKSTGGAIYAPCKGKAAIAAIVAENLSAVQAARIDALLRGWLGANY